MNHCRPPQNWSLECGAVQIAARQKSSQTTDGQYLIRFCKVLYRTLVCWDQYLSMAFAQLTYRDGLRDIEACLRSLGGKLYHMGFHGRVARSTLADANDSHDWRIYADFAQ